MDNYDFLPVIDANFNRCKEGLRVIEDIFRFVAEDDELRKEARAKKHKFVRIIEPVLIKKAINKRDSGKDKGRNLDSLESKRNNLGEILYVNLQRVKESLRVLEEFSKIAIKKHTGEIKELRYQIYEFEKKVMLKWPSLCLN